MRIAVLSGKGGTGKTLVSVNLAAAARQSLYVDCDVEEPNGHLFFKPEAVEEETISIKIPAVDDKACTGCRTCVDFCKFNALAYINNKLIIFDKMCHACGGCALFCPEIALTENDKIIGRIQKGISGDVFVSTGILNTGETSGVPIIKRLLSDEKLKTNLPAFIDCPPGSACIVIESLKDADYCLLVAEPTLFGVHNLKIVTKLVQLFNKPFGVVLNKCLEGENPAETFCLENKINILGRLPFDHELGRIHSNGKIAFRENTKHKTVFYSLLNTLNEAVQHETTAHP